MASATFFCALSRVWRPQSPTIRRCEAVRSAGGAFPKAESGVRAAAALKAKLWRRKRRRLRRSRGGIELYNISLSIRHKRLQFFMGLHGNLGAMGLSQHLGWR